MQATVQRHRKPRPLSRLTIDIPPAVHKRLRIKAAQDDTTMAAIITEQIVRVLDADEK